MTVATPPQAGFQPNLSAYQGNDLTVCSPIDGSVMANLRKHSSAEIDQMISNSCTAFEAWRVDRHAFAV
jgi:acyl-CoA reductase-like NAD-dependent aldehyde dehydrogenase